MSGPRLTALRARLARRLGLVTVRWHRLARHWHVPRSALLLGGAAVGAELVPRLHLGARTMEPIVSVALVFILFDGGMGLGWGRARSAAMQIASTGLLGTLAMVGVGTQLVHLFVGTSWFVSVLVATALAPTDPAVVFALLRRQELSGATRTILEGEAGANDPVGIAIMASLLAAGSLDVHGILAAGANFGVQLVVGGAIGVLGGRVLRLAVAATAPRGEGLVRLVGSGGALLIYAVATIAHGSPYLAVFLAGVVLGDEMRSSHRIVTRFQGSVAQLAEIVTFVALGLTVHLGELARADVLVPGIELAAALALVARPIVVGCCLVRSHLTSRERGFVSFAGLKGAVPLLLGSYLVADRVPGALRWYGIVVVAVMCSIVVEGALVPIVADRLGLTASTET